MKKNKYKEHIEQNSQTLFVTKLSNSYYEKLKTYIVTKLKTSNCKKEKKKEKFSPN